MSRRGDPEKIHQAQRAGTRQRLIAYEGVPESDAEAWLAAWEAQAARQNLDRGHAYWDAAWEWIAAEREKRAKP
jgi:hypothetical protein